jgi:hypothetical protein
MLTVAPSAPTTYTEKWVETGDLLDSNCRFLCNALYITENAIPGNELIKQAYRIECT